MGIVGLTISVSSQSIEWLQWEEAFDRSQIEQRKFVVKIYTDYCSWCKKMDKTTYAHPEIADYISKNYYAVNLDALHKESINYDGQEYKYSRSIKRGGLHQLALKLCGDKVLLPTTVFLEEDGSVIQAIPGYQNKDFFEMVISYFAEDYHKSTHWKQYTFNYQDRKQQKKSIRNDSSFTRMVSNNNQ